MSYTSNCPISRPTIQKLTEDADLGGISWNDEKGLFYATDEEAVPAKLPPPLYRPTVR